MATQPQRSRQQRALAQRQRELENYKAMDSLPPKPQPDEAHHTPPGIPWRNHTTAEDKAVKAARDVANLQRKLSQVATTSQEN